MKEKTLNCIFRIPHLDNSNDICELIFNDEYLCKENFAQFSNVISQSFATIIMKFNKIKEKEYFKNLMEKILKEFTEDNLNNAFNKFNASIYKEYEGMLYFLELIINNFESLKIIEYNINKKIFESLNYLINLDKINNKEQVLNQNNFSKLVIDIFYLLLNTKGKCNPKNFIEVFETIKVFLKEINKNLLLEIFYLFFVHLFEVPNKQKEHKLKNINLNYFSNLNIIELNYNSFDYLTKVIILFTSFEPILQIINLLFDYFNQIFNTYLKVFFTQGELIEKNDEKYILCNFHHIYRTKKVYYEFYLYLIKYSKNSENSPGIFELFPNLKAILMNIYTICPNPFYFEILIKSFINEDDLKENIKYIKEILDLILNLEYIDPNNNNLLKKEITIFNTIQLFQIFFFTSKNQKICRVFAETGVCEYILKFFEKAFDFIHSNYLIPININGEIYQKTILEICFDITIAIVLSINNDNIKQKFFDFFSQNELKITNNENEFGKSIVCISDLSNESFNNYNKDIKYQFIIYQSEDIKNYFKAKNYKKESRSLLIKFLKDLFLIKINQTQNNDINALNVDLYINKFINLFIGDLLLLIFSSSGINKSKYDEPLYNSLIDLLNKNNSDTQSIKEANLLNIFEDFCKSNKNLENILDKKVDLANFNLYNSSIDKCPLKKKCRLLAQNFVEDINLKPELTKECIKSYFDIDHKNVVKCLKKDLLLKDCSIFFEDIYLYDKNFKKIRNSFYYNYGDNLELYDYKNDFLNYPTKLKNFSSNKYALPKIFLSCNNEIYKSSRFSLLYPRIKKNLINNEFPNLPSHYTYYKELLNNITQNQISKNKLICELIVVKHIILGEIIFYPSFLVFKNLKRDEDEKIFREYDTSLKYVFSTDLKEIQITDKIILIEYGEIEEIFNRCFTYIPQSLEIFLKNGKSYFFNLIEENNINQFYDIILNIKKYYKFKVVQEPKKEFEKLNYTEKWKNEEITNEQYLLYLNKYSGRTYNDINQYPIFPWVTLTEEYFPEKITTNYVNDIIYRNMKYFMQGQTEKGRKDALFCYRNLNYQKHPVHFRIHYSTSGFILLYLMRIFPFMEQHIRLQNGKFDAPGRLMHKIEEMLKVLKDSKDNRELIPEFFTSIEYFINLNYVYFGARNSDDIVVNNILVPEINLYHQKLPNFIYFNKIFLNSTKDLTLNEEIDLKTCKIYKWINLVFGYWQYPPELNRLNTFEKFSNRKSYSLVNSINKLKKKGKNEDEILKKINGNKSRVLYFGQTPEQLFETKHCKYQYKKWVSNINFSEHKLNDMINDEIKIITFWISEDKDFFFFLVKNISNKNIYIYVYDKKLNKKNQINIGKIKLFSLINLINIYGTEKENKIKKQEKYEFQIIEKFVSNTFKYKDRSELYILNPRDTIIHFFDEYNIYYFVGRNKDNTIKIFNNENQIKGIIQLNSFVSVLYKKDKEIFFSGHQNGLLIEWKLDYKPIKYNTKSNFQLKNIFLQREIKAHNNSLITAINYNEKHNIILTSDINGILYIRKYYDFELLTKIKLKDDNCFTTHILVNDFNFIYTINYNKNKMKKYICLYTLNGILIEKSTLHTIIDIYNLNNGKIIFNRLEETELYMFGFNNKKNKNEAIINDNIFQKFDYQNINDIKNFVIKDNDIYILLRNGVFIKGFYNSLNLIGYGIN